MTLIKKSCRKCGRTDLKIVYGLNLCKECYVEKNLV